MTEPKPQYSFCPVDFTPIPMLDGIGACPKCERIYIQALTELQVSCDHIPQPLRGRYEFHSLEVPYAYCSAECKAESEQRYGSMMRDLGLS